MDDQAYALGPAGARSRPSDHVCAFYGRRGREGAGIVRTTRQERVLGVFDVQSSVSVDERRLIRELIDDGHPRVIAFTREELDPYHLFKRFENAPHKYAVGLRELAENTVALNIGKADRDFSDPPRTTDTGRI